MKALMSILAVLLTVGGLSAKDARNGHHREDPRLIRADSSCPADNPDARKAVIKFLSGSGYAGDRTDLGLSIDDTASVQVLVDTTDAAACGWFKRQVIPDSSRSWAYYKGHGYYFIPMVPRCTLCLRHGSLAIFDGSFTLKKTLGV